MYHILFFGVPTVFPAEMCNIARHMFVKHGQQYVWLKDEEQHERCNISPISVETSHPQLLLDISVCPLY